MEHSPYVDLLSVYDLKTRLEELADRNNLDEEERDELKTLREVADECEGLDDWEYDGMLISDSYFPDYAREMAADRGECGDLDAWPNNCIDWDEAADYLQQDYTSVEYGGQTFWIWSY